MLRRRKPDAEIEAALAKLQIFSSLSSQDLSELAAQCLRKEYAAGVAILEEGSTGLGLFLLTSGRVEVFKQHGDRRLHLAELGRGDILGELALIDQQPRSASAVALEDTECLLLTRDRFRSLAETRPRITWALVPRLAMRNRELQDQLMAAQHSARLETASSEAASSEAMPPEIAPSEGTSPETGTTLPTAAKPSIQEAATTPMLDSEAPAEDREPPS
ncbi:MAG: cyclic nucleotide-binding domain-containing protein, partial [Acidobacteriota bacterium]